MPIPQFNVLSQDIVAQIRLEPVFRQRDLTPAICASVHDALWMLSRQWRVKEFEGEDAGSVVKAKLETQSTYLNRYRGGKTGDVEIFDHKEPLEAKVERLPLIIDLAMSLEIGLQWYKILLKTGAGHAYSVFVNHFLVPLGSSSLEIQSNRSSILARKTASGRLMDGGAFFRYLENGNSAKSISGTFNSTEQANLDAAEIKFYNWIRNTYFQPEKAAEKTWSEEQLEYRFSLSAPDDSGNVAQTVLDADRYTSGNVDWYSVDANPNVNYKLTISPSDPGVVNGIIGPASVESYLLRPVKWKGMPKRRWWEFEDSSMDIAKIVAQKQDISKLILLEFGLIYSNDWFIIPKQLDNATLTQIGGLVVTDVFEQQFVIGRAGSGIGWQKWDMYQVNEKGESANAHSLNKLLLMPALINKVESEPIEKVLFLRDEMANMIWGVEDIVPNDMFGGISGKDAANNLAELLETMYPELNPADYVSGYQDTQAKSRYKLQSSVPENWIPFIPAEQVTPTDHRKRKIQRARMFRYSDNGQLATPILPRTNILRVHLDDPTPGPYRINQEEVSKSGFEISTTFQRTRWYDGKPFVWLGRKVSTGRGESGVGFEFDMLQDKEAEGAPPPPLPQLPVPYASGWWMAETGVSIVNGEVDSWQDQSGAGNHLSAPAILQRPPFNASGGANDRPYLNFDGTRCLYIQSLNLPVTQNITTFFVCRLTNSSAVGVLTELTPNFTSSNGGFCIGVNDGGTDLVAMTLRGNNGYSIGSAPVTGNNWFYLRTEGWKSRPLPESISYVNSGAAGVINPWSIPLSDNSNDFVTASPLYVGSRANNSFFLQGEVSEIIIYPRKLSVNEINAVEKYLDRKYNILGPLPQTPQIPAPDAGWWMADAGVTTVGGEVDIWADQSVKSNHLSAASALLRPPFSTNGGSNNMPYLDFTGSKALYISSFNIPATNDLTIFAVFKSTNASNVTVVAELTANTNNNNNGMFIAVNDSGSNTVDVGAKGNAGYSLGNNSITSSWLFVRAEAWKSRVSMEAMPYVNGGSAGSILINNDSTNGFSSVPLYIGSRANTGAYFQGAISEIIIYAKALTSIEITSVETYLKSKYNL